MRSCILLESKSAALVAATLVAALGVSTDGPPRATVAAAVAVAPWRPVALVAHAPTAVVGPDIAIGDGAAVAVEDAAPTETQTASLPPRGEGAVVGAALLEAVAEARGGPTRGGTTGALVAGHRGATSGPPG